MALRDIKGNQDVIRQLSNTVAAGSVSHAYMFESQSAEERFALAVNFIKAILCGESLDDACESCINCQKIEHGNYEDILFLAPEGGSIKDEAVEELQSRLKMKPLAGGRNIAVIEGADTMTVRAQNRFLKTLEEPGPGTVILLLVQNTEKLAVTILSRCTVYRLKEQELDPEEDELARVDQLGRMLLGKEPFYKIAKEAADFMADRESAAHFLDLLEIWLRDRLLSPYDEAGILKVRKTDKEKESGYFSTIDREDVYFFQDRVLTARKDLSRNMNPAYTIKTMILSMYE